jgi:predicted transcriptional regulator
MVKNKIHVIFRKSGPRRFTPDLIYAYFASPDSAICARFSLVSYDVLNLTEALKLTEQGHISREELVSYGRDRHELVVMQVGQVAIARTPITYAWRRERISRFQGVVFSGFVPGGWCA